MATDFVPVASLDEVQPRRPLTVAVGKRQIALFNVDGTIYALDDKCPHAGASLSDGWIDGNTVTCPWHAWCFRMTDGSMLLGDYSSVAVYDVRVADGVIHVATTPRTGTA